MDDVTKASRQGELAIETGLPRPHFRDPTPEEHTLKAQQLTQWREEIRDWLITYPFTAKLVMRLSLVMVVDSRVPTACTDGAHVFVNAHFAQQCSSALRRFVLGHELYHVLLGHFMRQYGRDRLRWNLAVDAEVNHRLMFDGFSLPGDAVFYPAQAGNSAEVIYQWLQGHPRPELDTPFDIHGDALHEPVGMRGDGATLVIDPDFAPLRVDANGARHITQQWRRAILDELQQAQGGSLPGGMALVVDEIADPEVDWRTCLHDFIRRHHGASLTWNRMDRRHLGQGRYLPGRQGKALSLMVAIDTSHSTRRQLPVFLAELRVMLDCADHTELHLIECDAAIQRERVITDPTELDATDQGGKAMSHPSGGHLRGGGGTDFRPVFARARELMPECLVLFTDGYGKAPEAPPALPVTWVITKGGKRPVSWGQSIHLRDT